MLYLAVRPPPTLATQPRTLRDVRYPNGNTSDQVPYYPLGLIDPQPVENGKTSEEKVSPLQHSLGRSEVRAERLRNYWLFGDVKLPESIASPSTDASTSVRCKSEIVAPLAFKHSKFHNLRADCPAPANSHASCDAI